jgi:hypothetical protein
MKADGEINGGLQEQCSWNNLLEVNGISSLTEIDFEAKLSELQTV